uniref:Uncharacterized protein MANES_08G007600 n=1 Tax=Rhizophora mucronata TaxID=61149 RepID=A0A2P2JWH4_RHIMU
MVIEIRVAAIDRSQLDFGIDLVGFWIGHKLDSRDYAEDIRREPRQVSEIHRPISVLGMALREVEDLGVHRRHLDHAAGAGMPKLRVQALVHLLGFLL